MSLGSPIHLVGILAIAAMPEIVRRFLRCHSFHAWLAGSQMHLKKRHMGRPALHCADVSQLVHSKGGQSGTEPQRGNDKKGAWPPCSACCSSLHLCLKEIALSRLAHMLHQSQLSERLTLQILMRSFRKSAAFFLKARFVDDCLKKECEWQRLQALMSAWLAQRELDYPIDEWQSL
eukprot:6172766-Pleurochrysis_carterae.AAC.1